MPQPQQSSPTWCSCAARIAVRFGQNACRPRGQFRFASCLSLLLLCLPLDQMVEAGSVMMSPAGGLNGGSTVVGGGGSTNDTDSHWQFACDQAHGAVVAWTCSPFIHEKDARHRFDADIAVRLLQQDGPMACAFASVADRTDVSHGRHQATVAAQLNGTGVGSFHVRVSFSGDPDLIPEGRFSTTVFGTVTSR